MKSRISFFNMAVVKKDIRRFAPAWGIYSVLLFFAFFKANVVDLFGNKACSFFDTMIVFSISTMPFYACICAMLLFGDLYKPRLCNALHAMPVRRESWFVSHVAAGVLFLLVPNAVIALIETAILGSNWYISIVWLALSLMQYLIFFGMAAFCAMCAGGKLSLAICYTILNFGAYLVTDFGNVFYTPLLYGVKTNASITNCFMPIAVLSDCAYLDTEFVGNGKYVLKGFVGKGFLYTGILAAVGVLFFVAAVLLYRRRKLELTGEVMAWRPAAVVFHLMFCLLSGVIFGIGGVIAAGFIGIILGFFGGQMLLQRKFNVFTKRLFKNLGLLLGVMALTMGITAADPLGVSTKVPDAQAVASVSIKEQYKPEAMGTLITTDTPEGIAAIIQLQKQLIAQKAETNPITYLVFEYKMKDGSTFKRYYPVREADLDRSLLSKCYTGWQSVFDTHSIEQLRSRIVLVRVDSPEDGGKSVVYSDDQEQLKHIQEDVRIKPLDEAAIYDMLRAMQFDYENEEPIRYGTGEVVDKDGYWVQIVTKEHGTYETRWYMIPESWSATIEEIKKCF